MNSACMKNEGRLLRNVCAPDLICCLRLPDISIMLRPRPQPIRGQYSGHVIFFNQSQASIQAAISPGAGRGQRQTPSGTLSQQDQHTSGQIKKESLTEKNKLYFAVFYKLLNFVLFSLGSFGT